MRHSGHRWPGVAALFVSGSRGIQRERTTIMSKPYFQYFGGVIAGVGLGFLICRACQSKGWLDVATNPLFIVGGGIMIALGVALTQFGRKAAVK